MHVHALTDPPTGAPVPGAVDAVERQPPGRQAEEHRGRDVGEHAVPGLALVPHRREQRVADLVPRRRSRSREVGAPAQADELPGSPLPTQLMIGPTRGEQLPTHDETRKVHATEHSGTALRAGRNERIARSHTNTGAHTRTAVGV